MTAERDYAGVSAEDRRLLRRKALIDATLTELEKLGPSELSARVIYQTAQLNPRYFQEAFSSVDEAVDAAFDTVTGGIIDASRQAIDDLPVDASFSDKVRAGYAATFAYIDADPRRLALGQYSSMTPSMRAKRHALVDDLADEMITDSAPAAGADNELRAKRMIAIALVNGTIELYFRHRSGQLPDVSNQELEDTLVGLVLSVSTES